MKNIYFILTLGLAMFVAGAMYADIGAKPKAIETTIDMVISVPVLMLSLFGLGYLAGKEENKF